jgi:hypothetical protein
VLAKRRERKEISAGKVQDDESAERTAVMDKLNGDS